VHFREPTERTQGAPVISEFYRVHPKRESDLPAVTATLRSDESTNLAAAERTPLRDYYYPCGSIPNSPVIFHSWPWKSGGNFAVFPSSQLPLFGADGGR
jgi:hypothetical protein